LPDLSAVLTLLAFLSIGLLSITVPTFAISVTFLGRESNRVRHELERRRKDLAKTLDGLGNSIEKGPGIDELKKEIETYETDIQTLDSRLGSLSVKGALVWPFGAFLIALSLVGYASFVMPDDLRLAEQCGALGGLAIAVGIVLVGRTLVAVNHAAILPETLSLFRVSFNTGLAVYEMKASAQARLGIVVHNVGREMAEKVTMIAFFPPGFNIVSGGIEGSGYAVTVGKPIPELAAMLSYPDYSHLRANFDNIHSDIKQCAIFNLTAPPSHKSYKIPVHVWEKRLGKSEHELTIDVS
jgi:hypothetical protein